MLLEVIGNSWSQQRTSLKSREERLSNEISIRTVKSCDIFLEGWKATCMHRCVHMLLGTTQEGPKDSPSSDLKVLKKQEVKVKAGL